MSNLESNYCVDNYLIQTLINIDNMQKDANRQGLGCEACNNTLLLAANNTIPFSLIHKGGTYLNAYETFDLDTSNTIYFKVESIRDNRYATLKLLKVVDDALTETTQTILVDLTDFVAIKCYSPINTTSCDLT